MLQGLILFVYERASFALQTYVFYHWDCINHIGDQNNPENNKEILFSK